MAKLYTSKNPSEHAIYHSTMLERAQSDDLYVSVKAYTLDSLLPEYGIDPSTVRWIKIDVEGAEYEVLKGAVNLLTHAHDITMLVEVHNIGEHTNLYEPILNLVLSHGFAIFHEIMYQGGEKHLFARKIDEFGKSLGELQITDRSLQVVRKAQG